MSGIQFWAVFKDHSHDIESAALFRLRRKAEEYRTAWDGEKSNWEILPATIQIIESLPPVIIVRRSE